MLILLAAFAAGCGEDDEEPAATQAETPSETATATEEAPAAEGCEQVDAPAPREDGDERRPARALDDDRTYTVTVVTNCGSFSWELDVKAAPKTSASIVSLADKGFYDDTIFHRIVPGFVIQGGDPTATGTGGPGYQTRDKPAADTVYEKGTVAMAKAGPEAAGTAGSQFFVVTDDTGGRALTPEYAVVGKVDDGLDVVERIGMLGDAAEQPTQTVVIEKMTVAVE
jgi:peptidyl-prolyl cis-trans isomerase B (cyclophilin B)